jgi:hypothetical protein
VLVEGNIADEAHAASSTKMHAKELRTGVRHRVVVTMTAAFSRAPHERRRRHGLLHLAVLSAERSRPTTDDPPLGCDDFHCAPPEGRGHALVSGASVIASHRACPTEHDETKGSTSAESHAPSADLTPQSFAWQALSCLIWSATA